MIKRAIAVSVSRLAKERVKLSRDNSSSPNKKKYAEKGNTKTREMILLIIPNIFFILRFSFDFPTYIIKYLPKYCNSF